MAAIKCIIRQDWETRNASGELLDRHNRVYVTNEDGTPHVYGSIREARAEIVSNYGRDANRAGILHSYSVDDYSGNIHSGWIYIVREGSEEYAEATESAEAEQETTEQNAAELAEIIAEQARDYYADTKYSAITAEDVEQADAYTNNHLPLTVEVMNALGIFRASNRMMVAIAQAMRWTLDDIEAQAIEEAHEQAARDLISAYAEAIGDAVTEDDPEAIAAHQVAREAIGYTTATDEDRAAVAAMVEAIADRARADAAEKANQAANDAITDANRAYEEADNWQAFFIELAEKAAAEAERLAVVANDKTITAKAGAVSAMTRRVREEIAAVAPVYQRFELLAYLGDPDAYDVEAIEAEATRYTADGARVWAAFGDDLAAIAERHELYSYAPAI